MRTYAPNRDVADFALRHESVNISNTQNLWTKTGRPSGIYGYLPKSLKKILDERYGHITQVIYSYSTPIAWEDDGVWIEPYVQYSVTTGRHQSSLYRLHSVRIPWDCGTGDEYEAFRTRKSVFRPWAKAGELTVVAGS